MEAHPSAGRLAIAKITGEGLCAIGFLVAVLWACLIGEQVIVRRANSQVRQTLNQVRILRMKQQVVPVSVPHSLRPLRPSLG